ncbi:L,D-transpeptidase [Aurantimonas sp. 22II-16-19i]|uniref:L,D-transpeptidase n=1 Tax=Aurantimonas sp. 22II-16-19i TaxID=1317114 RepID=UPI0009F7E6B2|nr:L,D-transpeptidase [Aurantimonas sp. 22II-16-19i]ORE99109.1 hypothetical protein ATO4_02045 [Aurantimonas sp. 22II-16-19i]
MLRRDALAALVLTTSLAASMPGALALDRGQPRPQVRIAAGVDGPWVMEFATPVSPSGVVLGARTPDSAAGVQSASLGNRAIQPGRPIDPQFLPQDVVYSGRETPGTIVIDSKSHFLYLVGENGTARRYGVGTGKTGFGWSGTHRITRKAEWPGWTPPRQMIARERKKGRILPAHMPGGPANPLGARAMYLGSTLYRIHGTNQPWTIGQNVSSGCIRMRNEDVTDLYERVRVGTRVVVL